MSDLEANTNKQKDEDKEKIVCGSKDIATGQKDFTGAFVVTFFDTPPSPEGEKICNQGQRGMQGGKCTTYKRIDGTYLVICA